MADFEFREIGVEEQGMLEQIGELRVRAWLTETPQAAEMTTWLEQFDKSSRHWVFLRNGAPVAAARLSIHASIVEAPDSEAFEDTTSDQFPAPIASFNRLVVHPSVRGLGLSKQLDLVRLATAEALGCRCAALATASFERRLRQLKRFGFLVTGQGKPYLHPPLCFMPAPVLLVCLLPRNRGSIPEGSKVLPSPECAGSNSK
jgi:GNAT superfamily N-acetyltransferase